MILCSHFFKWIYLEEKYCHIEINNASNKNNDFDNNRVENESNDITVKSVIEIYGKRMIRGSWLNERVCNKNLSLLEDLNLYDFTARYVVSIRGNWKSKLYSN